MLYVLFSFLSLQQFEDQYNFLLWSESIYTHVDNISFLLWCKYNAVSRVIFT